MRPCLKRRVKAVESSVLSFGWEGSGSGIGWMEGGVCSPFCLQGIVLKFV
jgi:hypothetical protein